MAFKDILVAVDGSDYSQTAASYGLWLASRLKARLTFQYVVDPEIVDLFVSPDFGDALGFDQTVNTAEKVLAVARKMGEVVLGIAAKEAESMGIECTTCLDVGHVVTKIVERSRNHELLVVGHRGRGHKKGLSDLLTGSVSERVIVESPRAVMVAIDPVEKMEQFLVAYDGSEASKGALLTAERLAAQTDKKLQALTVASSDKHMPEARLTAEQGESYLREKHEGQVFITAKGSHAETLIRHAESTKSLMVLGAYGFKKTYDIVLGSTATYIVRRTKTSILIYR